MSKIIQDQAARESIIKELDTCILVEAGAGSGKTSSLVQRMLALISTGYTRIEHIAAVTFTRKAAAELQERFQIAIEKALAKEVDPELKKRWEEALIDIDRCFIGTIHSFCGLVLGERPIEAGIAPDFQEVDDLEDRLVKEKAWQEYTRHLSIEPEKLKKLDAIDIAIADLKSMFDIISQYPDVEFGRQDDFPLPGLTSARIELYELLAAAQPVLPDTEPPRGWDNLQKKLRSALRWQRIHNLDDDINLLRLFATINSKCSVVLNRWLDKDTAKDMRDRFEWFRLNHLEPALEEWWNYRYDICLEILLEGLDYYEKQRKKQGILNFQDLLMKTAALLRDNPEVRRYFQDRFRCILIDEFQDTDPIQAQIMFYLASEEIAEKDWRKITPRKGSLFVVGDPKQSIYRFRRAEIDIYYEVKKRIADTGGKVFYLTSNFRSLESIGKWANPLFESYFPDETTSCQAGFKKLEMVRKNEIDCAEGVRVLQISIEGKARKADIVKKDAETIALWIAKAIQTGVKLSRTPEEIERGNSETVEPDDFMLLLRYKEDMDIYAKALEEKGIPYLITGGLGLSSSRELKDLLLILQAVQDPTDPVKLLAVLKGLYFGISDNQLYQYKKAGGIFNYQEEIVVEDLEAEIESVFRQSFERLKGYRQLFNELPPRTAVERIIIDNGLIPATMLGQSNKAVAAFPVQFLELLGDREINSLAALITFLQSLLEMGIEEEISLEGGNEKAVRLMNLHKAKGLEAPIVFLANPAKKVNRRASFHIDRKGQVPKGYLQLTRPKGRYSTEILANPRNWLEYARKENEYGEAEEMRLLYVAATRAKNLLLISDYAQKPDRNPWRPLIADIPPCTFLAASKLEEIPALGILKETDLEESELKKAREKFPSQNRAENLPSYLLRQVTALKTTAMGPRRKATGKGISWGTVIHRLLEIWIDEIPIDPEITIKRILAEEGRDSSEVSEVLILLQRIQETDFWKRIMKSDLRMSEVPIAASFPANGHDNQPELLISGIIDLIFWEPSGWVIADYKTDHIVDEKHLDELIDYYTPQLKNYRELWEKLGGGRVAECGLFFVSQMHYTRTFPL